MLDTSIINASTNNDEFRWFLIELVESQDIESHRKALLKDFIEINQDEEIEELREELEAEIKHTLKADIKKASIKKAFGKFKKGLDEINLR